MDPDILLASIRSKRKLIERWGIDSTIGRQAADALAIDCGYLDEWLSKGGFLPVAWSDQRTGRG